MIKEYVRDKNRNPIGILIATEKDGELLVGWSACNPKDQWSKDLGEFKAHCRLLPLSPKRLERLPQNYRDQMGKFLVRCSRYYRADIGQAFNEGE